MLIIENITKRYTKSDVLNNFSLTLDSDKIGIYGENGIGKSTLLNIISGFVEPCSGTVTIDGFTRNDKMYRYLLGIVLDEPLYIEELTVEEMLFFFGGIFNFPKKQYKEISENLISLFELSDYRNTRIKVLSKGFRARISLALALYAKPKYLILDEPFDGMDQDIQEKIITYLRNSDYSYIISMHNKEKLKYLCNRLITIK